MDWETFFRNYRTPDFVPGFTILNKLGSGVFGEVYKAKRTSIGKLYAIKFLRLQDERLQEQVLRELDSVDHFAQVDHPNLVSIEDRGEICGIPYIIMGYAGDETLKVRLQDGPLPLDHALPLFRQVLRGVKALHEHSIIHFDLKPANVFIKGDVARVGDYGLSKLMSESRATLSMGRGTPHYMAPEMLRRRGDARSDVYSLGVIFFEMLTGTVPFRGETEWEILKRHESEIPSIPDSVSPSLRTFLKQCLGKNPESRFPNSGAQLAAFESAVAALGGAGPVAVAVAGKGVMPPPLPEHASPSVAAGAALGRFAARGRVTVEKVRQELHGVLEKVREETRGAMVAARDNYRHAAREAAAAAPPETPSLWARHSARRQERRARRDARLAVRSARAQAAAAAAASAAAAPPRRRGLARSLLRGLFLGVGRLVAFPFALLGWSLRNLVQVIVVVGIIAALCIALHLGLQSAIL